MQRKVRSLIDGRNALLKGLASLAPLGVAPSIGGNDANFVVVPILAKPASAAAALQGQPDNKRAFRLYKTLAETHAVVVRFRGHEPGCDGCLRITVGTEAENAEVLARIKEVLSEI